ncbi:uncharacterized protein LY89DRAFT_767551 [Mollisia scopiformis]|uniref:Tat pathway signal sequence n=1 Tax=Mollisia scopiformis TaxID=149040 RepID=A0A194XP84_MOLSC|nr:uncharacterized protein LY89DRAFT_767551 [Mollisia scopiformis]KUJ21547.1 hypothetical protein LY89DRAFT_767551 [Mollisia scopiformis]
MSSKEYHPLALGDHRDDESEDSLPPTYLSDFRKRRTSSALQWGLYVFGLVLTVAVTAFVSTAIAQQHLIRTAPGDGLDSNMPTEVRIISKTPPDQMEKIWDTLITREQGLVWIDNPEEHGFPPGLPNGPGGQRNVYGLSYAHQLHCLMMIRNEYHALQRNESKQILGPDGEASLDTMTKRRIHHIEHCFDYLRQSVECVSDMTIEWADPEPDELGNLYHINGYGVLHQCRKRESVINFSAARRPPLVAHPEEGGIDGQ